MAPMFDLVERLICSSSENSMDQSLDEPISEPVSQSSSGLTTPNFAQTFGFSNRQRLYSEADSGINSV